MLCSGWMLLPATVGDMPSIFLWPVRKMNCILYLYKAARTGYFCSSRYLSCFYLLLFCLDTFCCGYAAIGCTCLGHEGMGWRMLVPRLVGIWIISDTWIIERRVESTILQKSTILNCPLTTLIIGVLLCWWKHHQQTGTCVAPSRITLWLFNDVLWKMTHEKMICLSFKLWFSIAMLVYLRVPQSAVSWWQFPILDLLADGRWGFPTAHWWAMKKRTLRGEIFCVRCGMVGGICPLTSFPGWVV